MAICGNCGSEESRVRSRWHARTGEKLPDECPQCSPGSFEKFQTPSDRKIWMGYEARPNEYQKVYDKDGVIFERKPEYRAEQEQRLRSETEEERDNRIRAEREKRKHRRTRPMDREELESALKKSADIADALVQTGGSLN